MEIGGGRDVDNGSLLRIMLGRWCLGATVKVFRGVGVKVGNYAW